MATFGVTGLPYLDDAPVRHPFLRWGMTRIGSRRPRVALAAVPPLLAESLRALLEDRGEVTVLRGPTDVRFDLAIVTPHTANVRAKLVVILDVDRSAKGGGTVRGVDSRTGRRLATLDELLAFVDHLGDQQRRWPSGDTPET
jgi:hypothetical protein